jgi:hypothetical protein
VVDRNLLAAIQEAADSLLASLDLLEGTDRQQLAPLLKVIRKKIVHFLKIVIQR